MFIIVEFVNGDGLAVVPCNWILNEENDQCYWPNTTSSITIDNYVRTRKEPDPKTWALYYIDIIKQYDSYEQARRKLPKAVNNSSLSDTDPGGKRKRTPFIPMQNNEEVKCQSSTKSKFQKTVNIPAPPSFPSCANLYSQNDICEDDHNNSSEYVNSVLSPAASNVVYDADNELEYGEKPTYTNLSPASSHNTTPVRNVRDNFIRHQTSQLPGRCSVSGPNDAQTETSLLCNRMSDTDFKRYCVTNLSAIKANQTLTLKLLQGISSSAEAVSLDSCLEESVLKQPFTDMEQLLMFDNKLESDVALKKNVVTVLRQIGGNSTADVINGILRAIMTDNLALHFTYTGQNGKQSFKNLKLNEIIFRAVRLQKATSTLSDKEITSQIQIWLSHSRDRIKYFEKKAAHKMAVEAAKTRNPNHRNVGPAAEDEIGS